MDRRYIAAAAAAALFNTPNVVHPAVAAGSGYTPLKQKTNKKCYAHTHAAILSGARKSRPSTKLVVVGGRFCSPENQWGKMSKRYINTAEKTHKREGNLKWLSAVLLNYPRKYKEKRKKRMKTNE
jgi:hypothetical protein